MAHMEKPSNKSNRKLQKLAISQDGYMTGRPKKDFTFEIQRRDSKMRVQVT
jgi:hypothetical protein